MSQKTVFFIWILLGSVILTGFDDYDYQEDLYREYLRLQIDKNTILAFSGTEHPVSIALQTGETVKIIRQKGYVGAVLTNIRFLAISSVSGRWLSESLNLDEEDNADLILGEKVAMLVTNSRIIGFTYRRDSFVYYELPMGKRIIEKDAGKDFGIVVMSDRAVGLSSKTGDFTETDFDMDESFKSLEMAATFALVNTNDNIYSYRGSSGAWSVRPKPPMQ